MKQLIILFFFILISCTPRLTIPSAEKQAVPASTLETEKIKQGIELHDRGFYEKALKLYREALNINPANVLALYESALTCFHMGDNERSLRFALKGMEYESELLARFYMMAGNNLDIMGKPRQAIEVFQKALEIDPEHGLFYYNLGITYFGMKDYPRAVYYFNESIKRSPRHASSHMGLAEVYIAQNKQIEALLMLSRFLTLEPKSRRALIALQKLDYVMNAGITRADDNKTININISAPGNSGGPQLSMMEMFYKLNRTGRFLDENRDRPEIELRIMDFSALTSFMNKDKLKESDSFTERYLISYFRDLSDAGFIGPFVYYIHQQVNDKVIQDWLKQNWPQIREFEKWNDAWPEGFKFRTTIPRSDPPGNNGKM